MPKNKDKIVAEGERWDRFLDWLLTELLKGGYIQNDLP